MVKKALGTRRYHDRQIRKFNLWLSMIAVHHPPVKGVSARKKWKNMSMKTRFRLDVARRNRAALERRVADATIEMTRAVPHAEVTIL